MYHNKNYSKPKRPTLSELEKERNSLLVSRKNTKRLHEIIAYLDWIYWGIKK